MPVIPYQGHSPVIGKNVFVAPTAYITGNVIVEDNASFFFNAVVRGDINQIRIGEGTNLQESVLVHTSTGRGDCLVGKNVTVGHGAILHGCTVEDSSLIGMGSTILDDAVIGKHCIIGAHSLVTEGKRIPDGTLALGAPARVIRDVTEEELRQFLYNAKHYQTVSKEYRQYFGEN